MKKYILLFGKPLRGQTVSRLTPCHPSHFHSSSRRYTQKDVRSHTTGAKVPPSLPMLTRQISINGYNSITTCQEDILESLEYFHKPSTQQADRLESENQALVILATPNYASWLEEPGFINQVLRKINKTSSWNGGFRREIDVVCACVDGLAPKPEEILSYREKPAIEGFSFLYGRRELILPDRTDDELKSSTSSSPSLLSSITFSEDLTSGAYDITVPLATTLFRNGRHSTLLVSTWWQDSASSFKRISEPLEQKNVRIQVSRSEATKSFDTYIPVVQLTPARRIVNGLGNIVRRLDFGHGVVGPASEELERRVNSELALNPGTKPEVWALIVPADAIAKGDGGSNALALNHPQATESPHASGTADYLYIGYWLSRGATFCRVLSGGGGWGTKQGLLSLDPQMTYSEITEARFDFSEESLEDQQAKALGRMAKEGDYIQFFRAEQNEELSGAISDQLHRPSDTTTVIGTIPSTRDEIPAFQDAATVIKPDNKGPLSTRKGHFGCVSESGIFLRRSKAGQPIWVSKVDLPYSYLFVGEEQISQSTKL